MNRTRHGGTRRFSLVKLEITSSDSNSLTTGFIHQNQSFKILLLFFLSLSSDDFKTSAPSTSPNLIQKLLFRQFSPKTRPYPTAIAVSACKSLFFFIYSFIYNSFQSDDNTSSSTVSNDTLK